MTAVCHEVIVPYSCKQMYVLVNDVDSYDQFIPWCHESVIDEVHDDASVSATLKLKHKGISVSFTTRNKSIPEEKVTMEHISGPFKYLKGEWEFVLLGDEGSKVSFCLDYQFSNMVYENLFSAIFDKLANSIVTAFLDRAKQIYG